jgi:transcriptional regulator with XRE-family HTH domain
MGEKIGRGIGALGVSQREFASRVGCTEISISRYVNNQRIPHAPILLNIARALGVSADYLLDDSMDGEANDCE